MVKCWIFTVPGEGPSSSAYRADDDDLPALAVPDALWEDEAFVDALQSRVGEPTRRLWKKCIDAIAAELKERANA